VSSVIAMRTNTAAYVIPNVEMGINRLDAVFVTNSVLLGLMMMELRHVSNLVPTAEVLVILGSFVMDSVVMECFGAAKQIMVLEIVKNMVRLCIQNVDPTFML
jgi:hypothetical protein